MKTLSAGTRFLFRSAGLYVHGANLHGAFMATTGAESEACRRMRDRLRLTCRRHGVLK